MKTLCVFACLIAPLATAAANTYVGPPIPSCSSSSDLIITVTSLGKAANGVRVDVYRKIENGERASWTGFTASDGTAKPSAFSPGEYRVFADAGDRTGMMSLLVGQFEGTTRCNLKIGPPNSVEAGEQTPEEPSNLQLKEFRGIVVDDKKVPIPHVIVRVLRSGSSQGYLAQFQSDENGRFELHLGKGVYVGTFAYQGFRMRMILFRLSSEGWQGVELGLTLNGSPTHDLPGVEWSSGPVTDNWGRIGTERTRSKACCDEMGLKPGFLTKSDVARLEGAPFQSNPASGAARGAALQNDPNVASGGATVQGKPVAFADTSPTQNKSRKLAS